MENNYCVYMHTSPNGKVYIGITSRKVNERWQNGKGYRDNQHFTKAIKKYGWDHIQHEILLDGLTREQASEYERMYIAFYDSTNPAKGYNLTTGGESNYYMTKEFSNKCSERMKKKYSTEEGRKEASERTLKIWASENFKNKMKNIKKEIWQRPDYREKISASRSETNKKRWSENGDLRKRMSGKNSPVAKPIRQYTLNGEYIKTYYSQKEAADKLGIKGVSHIGDCARGKRKTAYGYIWRYADGNESEV